MSDTVYIADADHYNKVLIRAASVRSSLWIATADIKDLHVRVGQGRLPFLGVLAGLLEKGVEIRLMHAKEPGPDLRADFDRYSALWSGLKRRLCREFTSRS